MAVFHSFKWRLRGRSGGSCRTISDTGNSGGDRGDGSDAQGIRSANRFGGHCQADSAPLYDAAPTLLLYARSSNAGHSVAGQARLNYITLDHLVREGVTWGMDSGVARTAVGEVLMAAANAHVPVSEGLEHLPALIVDRASDLLVGRTARR
jgi:hypothetical protein